MVVSIISLFAVLAAGGACLAWGAFDGLRWLWLLPVSFACAWLALAALGFMVLWISCALVRLDRPQDEDSPYYRKLMMLAVDFALSVLQVRIHRDGDAVLPEGRFVLVCNHLSLLDPLILLRCFPHSQLAFISKKENRKLFLINKLMHKTLCQLLDREDDRAALRTILKCVSLIKEDKVSIGVFPEGYTSRDGCLHEFRNGVFKVAQRAGVPIVVCALTNTQHIFRRAVTLRGTDVRLGTLAVIPAEDLRGVHTAEIGSRVHRVMAEYLENAEEGRP